MKIRAPAKINLGLRVVGRRADGYHFIDTIMVPVSLYDEIDIRKIPTASRNQAGDELIKVEEGLLGIELDPGFMANGWVYLHYTPHAQINRDTLSTLNIQFADDAIGWCSNSKSTCWPITTSSCSR